ncbi:MAG TPA: DUF6587 family protein [Xanthomonadaceae bacterium]|nr:DUF6587 family protein [Xanthomonadaceae bacterium]
MQAGLLAQYVVVTVAVLLSVVVVARKQFPEGVRRLRIACAIPLVRAGRAPWLQRLGRWLAPAPRGGGGDGCDGCNGCDDRK